MIFQKFVAFFSKCRLKSVAFVFHLYRQGVFIVFSLDFCMNYIGVFLAELDLSARVFSYKKRTNKAFLV